MQKFAQLAQVVAASSSTSGARSELCFFFYSGRVVACFIFYVFASKILLLKCKIENGCDVRAAAVVDASRARAGAGAAVGFVGVTKLMHMSDA